MPVLLLPQRHLTLKEIYKVARGGKVGLSGVGARLVRRGRVAVERIMRDRKPVYGLNTGFGALATVKISEEDTARLQENLILSHAAGVGEPLSAEVVRSAMFLRANMLSKGYSGASEGLIRQLIEMLNCGIIPFVPEVGSVGASGDLAPLAHIALTLIGKGRAFLDGELMSSRAALKAVGLPPYELKPKEGLALINGTEVMSAMGALLALRAQELAAAADFAAAFSCAALGADTEAFADSLQGLKPFLEQKEVAQTLRTYLKGSKPAHNIIQDAYSLRCIPQVHGAARRGLKFARQTVETEVNSVTDNPVLIGNAAVSGGNFHGAAIAFALDVMAIALTQLGGISERRIFRLLDTKLSNLPSFLAPNAGLNSGLMVAQLTAATLMTECKIMSAPASVHSLPTSGGQEDFVSMGMNSALKAQRTADAVSAIIAIELLCACQALDLSGRQVPKALRAPYRRIRSEVPTMVRDREVARDIQKTQALLSELVQSSI